MDVSTLAFDHIALAKRLSEFVGSAVAVAGGAFTAYDSPYIQEQQLVANAVKSRRTEFFSGRHYARQALREINIPDAPVLRGDKGNPLWPTGVLGSISHDLGQVVAIATVSNVVRGIGIDLVLDPGRVEQSLQSLIAHPAELNLVANTFADIPALALVFSLKESAVKAVSPRVDYYFDLMDIELMVHEGEIYAQFTRLGLKLRCGFITLPDGLLTFAVDADHQC